MVGCAIWSRSPCGWGLVGRYLGCLLTRHAMTIHDTPVRALDGSAATLEDHRDEAMLLVNVASRCGLTPQYAQLEELHDEYRDRGFTVIGVPWTPDDPAVVAEVADVLPRCAPARVDADLMASVAGDAAASAHEQALEERGPRSGGPLFGRARAAVGTGDPSHHLLDVQAAAGPGGPAARTTGGGSAHRGSLSGQLGGRTRVVPGG
jgi:hypothetical protein